MTVRGRDGTIDPLPEEATEKREALIPPIDELTNPPAVWEKLRRAKGGVQRDVKGRATLSLEGVSDQVGSSMRAISALTGHEKFLASGMERYGASGVGVEVLDHDEIGGIKNSVLGELKNAQIGLSKYRYLNNRVLLEAEDLKIEIHKKYGPQLRDLRVNLAKCENFDEALDVVKECCQNSPDFIELVEENFEVWPGESLGAEKVISDWEVMLNSLHAMHDTDCTIQFAGIAEMDAETGKPKLKVYPVIRKIFGGPWLQAKKRDDETENS